MPFTRFFIQFAKIVEIWGNMKTFVEKVQIWGNTRLTSCRNFEELGGKIVEKNVQCGNFRGFLSPRINIIGIVSEFFPLGQSKPGDWLYLNWKLQ